MTTGYAFRDISRTPGQIVEQLRSQGVKVSKYEPMEIGSSVSPYQSHNIPFADICDNPRVQRVIGSIPHSDIWYNPDKETINVMMYNLDPNKMGTETYHQLFISEMVRVLAVLEKILPEADLRLASRISLSEIRDLSPEDIISFKEAKEAYKFAMEMYRADMA